MSNLPLPRLLHPTWIKIRKANQSGSKYDRQAREPIGKVARGSVIPIRSQVCWKNSKFEIEREGGKVTVDGYLLFLRSDLVSLGIDIDYQDQIIEMGTGVAIREVNLYVEAIQYRGHNPNYGGHTLVKAWFSDKAPVRHS